jgi:esterase/lipase
MKKPLILDYGVLTEQNNAKGIVIYSHGFWNFVNKGKKIFEICREMGYDTFHYNLRGHGKRFFTSRQDDWLKMMDELDDFVNYSAEKYKLIFLIGHSMGATISVSLTNVNRNITAVFGVCAINGVDYYDTTWRKTTRIVKGQAVMLFNNVKKAFPENFNKVRKDNKNRFFFIHSKYDELVPVSQFYHNIEQLGLNIDTNGLLLDEKRRWSDLSPHRSTMLRQETKDYIINKIKELE